MAMRLHLTIVCVALFAGIVQAQSQALDNQELCAVQARRTFQQYEKDSNTGPLADFGQTISSDSQSHFNTKLKKCFILIEAKSSGGNSATLFDAYERRAYANYLWIAREDKKYWEVPPTTCEMMPTRVAKKICESREEFDLFVKSYLEE